MRSFPLLLAFAAINVVHSAPINGSNHASLPSHTHNIPSKRTHRPQHNKRQQHHRTIRVCVNVANEPVAQPTNGSCNGSDRLVDFDRNDPLLAGFHSRPFVGEPAHSFGDVTASKPHNGIRLNITVGILGSPTNQGNPQTPDFLDPSGLMDPTSNSPDSSTDPTSNRNQITNGNSRGSRPGAGRGTSAGTSAGSGDGSGIGNDGRLFGGNAGPTFLGLPGSGTSDPDGARESNRGITADIHACILGGDCGAAPRSSSNATGGGTSNGQSNGTGDNGDGSFDPSNNRPVFAGPPGSLDGAGSPPQAGRFSGGPNGRGPSGDSGNDSPQGPGGDLDPGDDGSNPAVDSPVAPGDPSDNSSPNDDPSGSPSDSSEDGSPSSSSSASPVAPGDPSDNNPPNDDPSGSPSDSFEGGSPSSSSSADDSPVAPGGPSDNSSPNDDPNGSPSGSSEDGSPSSSSSSADDSPPDNNPSDDPPDDAQKGHDHPHGPTNEGSDRHHNNGSVDHSVDPADNGSGSGDHSEGESHFSGHFGGDPNSGGSGSGDHLDDRPNKGDSLKSDASGTGSLDAGDPSGVDRLSDSGFPPDADSSLPKGQSQSFDPSIHPSDSQLPAGDGHSADPPEDESSPNGFTVTNPTGIHRHRHGHDHGRLQVDDPSSFGSSNAFKPPHRITHHHFNGAGADSRGGKATPDPEHQEELGSDPAKHSSSDASWFDQDHEPPSHAVYHGSEHHHPPGHRPDKYSFSAPPPLNRRGKWVCRYEYY